MERALDAEFDVVGDFFIEEDEIAIGIIGRIVPVKNHQLFIAAVDRLRKLTYKKLKFQVLSFCK